MMTIDIKGDIRPRNLETRVVRSNALVTLLYLINIGLLYRLAINLEYLEYSGISLNVENSWNHQGILCSVREKL